MKFDEKFTRKVYSKCYKKQIFNFLFPIVYGAIRKNGNISIEGSVNNSHHLQAGKRDFDYLNKISDILASLTYSRKWVKDSIKMANGDQLFIDAGGMAHVGFFPMNQSSINYNDHVYHIMVEAGLNKLASHYIKTCLANADKIIDTEYLNEKLNMHYDFESYI